MAWIQIRINSTNKKAESLSDYLESLGAVSVTFMDSQDTPIFEPLRAKHVCEIQMWWLCLMRKRIWRRLCNNCSAKQLHKDMAYKVEQIEDKDWEEGMDG